MRDSREPHTVYTRCARCAHGVHAVGRRRRACRAVCPSDEHGAMLPRLADLRAERAAWAVCKKAGGMANAGTRQAASTLASRLAPRHPRQACRPTYDSLHACVARQLKAEPGEAAALAQPRHIARPRQQLGNPTRRSECSRPISWSAEASGPSHGQPGRIGADGEPFSGGSFGVNLSFGQNLGIYMFLRTEPWPLAMAEKAPGPNLQILAGPDRSRSPL